jgi:hypothetical protein
VTPSLARPLLRPPSVHPSPGVVEAQQCGQVTDGLEEPNELSSVSLHSAPPNPFIQHLRKYACRSRTNCLVPRVVEAQQCGGMALTPRYSVSMLAGAERTVYGADSSLQLARPPSLPRGGVAVAFQYLWCWYSGSLYGALATLRAPTTDIYDGDIFDVYPPRYEQLTSSTLRPSSFYSILLVLPILVVYSGSFYMFLLYFAYPPRFWRPETKQAQMNQIRDILGRKASGLIRRARPWCRGSGLLKLIRTVSPPSLGGSCCMLADAAPLRTTALAHSS